MGDIEAGCGRAAGGEGSCAPVQMPMALLGAPIGTAVQPSWHMHVQVGEGAVLMGHLPLERTLVSIASGAVVGSSALVEGHYLESLMFNYKPCR